MKHTMKHNLKSLIIALSMCVCGSTAYADGVLVGWSNSDVSEMNTKAIDAVTALPVAVLVQRNLTVKTWSDAFMMLIGATAHIRDANFHKAMIDQITNTSEVQLRGTRRLIIWERI